MSTTRADVAKEVAGLKKELKVVLEAKKCC